MNNKLCITVFIAFLVFITSNASEIWVSPKGNDYNPGTKEAPLATIAMAQRKAREMRRLNDPRIKNGIEIILMSGTYSLDEPLLFRSEDSGTDKSPTLIRSAKGVNPVISGGVKITGWKKSPEKDLSAFPVTSHSQLWEADIPLVGGHQLLFRQMWVNDRKAQRASNLDDDSLSRILSVDKEKEILWIPRPEIDIEKSLNLELTIHQWWAIAQLRVKSFIDKGDSIGVQFYHPESRLEFEHPWPAPFIDEEKKLNGNSAFFFSNSPQLLNRPGEWYADTQRGKIYYWPHDDENPNLLETVVPYLENLFIFEGTLDAPVQHVSLKGLEFRHTTWLRPSLQGHVPLQAGMYLLEAYNLEVKGTSDKNSLCNLAWTGRQPAGLVMKNAGHIEIENCQFRQMAATAIDMETGTFNNLIQGCLIKDIGGTGIQAGFFGGPEFEAHSPYNPTDPRELCRFINISNNLITDVTNEDWGCVGISIGYAHDVLVKHNEISDINYSGICIGWGWTSTVTCMKNNLIHANKIHHFAKMMYDVGGIYTLSAQPNSVISNNAIFDLVDAPYAHIPDHHQYIYHDEGSSYFRVFDNWTEKDKFFSNTPGPGNEWGENGPTVNEKIKKNAGLTSDYHFLYNLLLR